MLKLQLGAIKVLFQKSIVNIEHRYNSPFYSGLHNFVSRQFIQHIAKEFERVTFIGFDRDARG